MVDEYAHLLRDFQGLFSKDGDDLAEAIASAIGRVVSLRTANLRLDEISIGRGQTRRRDRRLRSRFAMRFGRERAEQERDAVREDPCATPGASGTAG